jgi:hypothetical protein
MTTFTLAAGDVRFEGDAIIIPGRPERRPDLNHPGDPAESPEIQTLNLYLECDQGHMTRIEDEGLFIKEGEKFVSLYDAAEEAAIEAFSEEE